jgi:SAM-dependent methyltransferase
MSTYKNHTMLQAKGVKVFLSLKAGITRGAVPDGFEITAEQDQSLALQQAKDQIESQRRQLNRNKKLLSEKDRRIAQLEKRLAKEGKPARGRANQQLDSVILDGVTIPPKNLRPCGAKFQNDEFYLASARKEADKLVKYLGLTPESSLLDVGSGPGRLAIGILERVGEIRKYRGVDVDENSIRWAQHYITPRAPKFQFLHIDVENTRYNPSGSHRDFEFTFPFADEEFDIVILYSVFTHMLTEGIRAYLEEFQRMLRPDGKIFLTAFIEEDEGIPDVTENPEGYLGREWKGPLHCVRYSRRFFETLLDENGFRLDGFEPERESQRGLFISKKTGSPILT